MNCKLLWAIKKSYSQDSSIIMETLSSLPVKTIHASFGEINYQKKNINGSYKNFNFYYFFEVLFFGKHLPIFCLMKRIIYSELRITIDFGLDNH